MNNWIIPSFITLVLWSLCGIFPKLAIKYIDPKSALIFQIIGFVLVLLFVIFILKIHIHVHARGILFSSLTGITSAFGALFFLVALKNGKVSTVVSTTALYPALTLFFALIFLKESISVQQIFGFVLAVAAIFLMTS